MTPSVPPKGDPSIRTLVAARLYARPLPPPPPRKAPTRRLMEAPTPITVGQVVRAGMVLAVVLMLAPAPRIDGAPSTPATIEAQR